MIERLYLYDTTLRDGAQTQGVDFTLEDKHAIMSLLDRLGVDYIEGGYPGANPVDTDLFRVPPALRACLVAFGMTRRPGRSVENDPGIRDLLAARGAQAICFVAKSWDYHVALALETGLEDNLVAIRESVAAARAAGREVLVDCEHFFDGYKANPAYALACARTAHEQGARWVVLCDTNGGTQPHEIDTIVRDVCQHVPGTCLGIHAHDDTGQAVANSLAAVRAGVRQIQGTLNGLGERCGNASLCTLIPTLMLKADYARSLHIGVSGTALADLTHISRALDELLNRPSDPQAPFVGEAAFATKAGIHASALAKDPATYEHVPPQSVGNRRRIMVSDQAGKSNLLSELERIGLEAHRDDPRLSRLLEEIKQREAAGYSYESADASFELLARRSFGSVPEFFSVERFKVIVERRFNSAGVLETFSEASVKVRIDDEVMLSVAEGNGPVHALDLALRKDLGKYQALISAMRLTDYRVRVLNGGTEAVTRVLLESALDHRRWTTVGVSPNIVDASFEALLESINYALFRAQGLS